MRIFTAGIMTETNTFAPWPTGMRGFEEGGISHGDAAHSATQSNANTDMNLVARLYRELAATDGHEFVEGLFACAQPSGPTLQNVWESLRDEIVDTVRMQGPFDVILLLLHGAMVSTNCDNCEVDLLQKLRLVTPADTVIGVELDPHCHMSQALIDAADVVILMKEYPHIDYLPRARELYTICIAKAAKEKHPVSALFDLRMIGFYPTTTEPMAGLLQFMRDVEQRLGILSVSFAHGFPWGDTPNTGSKLLVIADADVALAASTAEEIGRKIYAARDALLPRMPGIEEALDQAENTPGVVVLADTADNAGGGAPSDNVSLLRAMLVRDIKHAALGAIWDPMVVQACIEAGVGARIQLRLGGKSGAASGDALDVAATVRAIRENHDQSGLGASRAAMGASVWLECGGIDVVVNSIREQVFSPDAFTGLGIKLGDKRLVAVKSSHHFYANFSPIADCIISVATPGAIQMNFADIVYRKRRNLNFYPRVNDPLSDPLI